MHQRERERESNERERERKKIVHMQSQQNYITT